MFHRSRSVPLLFVLLVGATAAVPSTESVYRSAKAAFDRGDNATAKSIAEPALARIGPADDQWAWRLRTVYGNVLINQGQSKAARELLGRGLPASLAGTDIEVLRLQGLALAASRLEDDAGALSLIAQAYEIAKKKQQRTLPMLLVVRATIDTANRMKWSREALRYATQFGDIGAEVRARGTIGNDLAAAERFDEAIAIWEQAVPKARQTGNESLMQKLEGNLGWAYMELGDYETAGDFFTRAHAAATRLEIKMDVVPWTYQLGNVRLQQDDLAAAEKQYRAAYDLARKTKHVQLPIVLTYLANFELLRGHVAEAQRLSEEALRERKDLEGELRSLLMAGRIATVAGRLDEAKRLIRDVLARSGSATTKWEASGRLAQVYVREGDAGAAEKHFQLSVETARAARASIGNERLRFAFFTAVEEIFDSYIDFLVARGRDTEALNVTEIARAQTLEEGLDDIVARRDVRTIARDTGATILCYWLGAARSHLWIVTPQSVKAFPLPPKKKIESMVEAYQKNLASGAAGSLSQSGPRGVELWRTLVEPASRVIARGSRVIIVPDGRLHAFNMETLVVPHPKKPHYWIEDAVLSTAGSLGLLVRKESKSTAAPRLLLVGNPPQPAKEFAALPRAGEEIRKVAKHFGGRVKILEGSQATASAYRASTPEAFTYLHFVAHGDAKRLKPLDSAVVLAREADDTFKLYARDIAKQPLNARLVTISSCHGAGTRAYAGEGLVGLGWAFLRAGADNVIAALWEVSDNATPKLMDEFYARLVKGDDPATALRAAKLTLVTKSGAHSRPYYWAPFLLYGSS